MNRILVIDDDDDFRKMLALTLTRAGYDVMEAPNGREGLKIYQSNRIDLVITDIFMPEKEGIETIIELKEFDRDSKIIAVSGGRDHEFVDILDFLEDFGVSKKFKKPFTTQELLTEIGVLLKTG